MSNDEIYFTRPYYDLCEAEIKQDMVPLQGLP